MLAMHFQAARYHNASACFWRFALDDVGPVGHLARILRLRGFGISISVEDLSKSPRQAELNPRTFHGLMLP